MEDDDIMFVLEAIAYISASIAAFVYIWETCFMTKIKDIKKRNNAKDTEIENRRHLSSSGNSNQSLFDEF
tara:strand:+ start:562 stop:771 length:210 start_codon:yes stop_codon:yes gene_type:complete